MRFLWSLASCAVAFLELVRARSSSGDSVLVLLEPGLKREDYSIFFTGLEDKGYDLTFRNPKERSPVVIKDEYPQFNHVIFFAPETKKYAEDLTPQSLVSLVSKNTNLLLVLSPKQTPLTSLASEFSLIPAPPGTPLLSHFPPRPEPPTVIPIPAPTSHPFLSPNLPPVWFEGVPFAFSPNPLLVPVLNAPPQSFAAESESDAGADAVVDAAEKGGEGLWAGGKLGVVAGFQAQSNARVTWVGGVKVFSDEFAKKEVEKGVKSGNEQFAAEIVAWTFQELNVLRIDSVEHHRVNETAPRETYTTNDQLVFTTHISKYNPVSSKWEPYSGLNDLQLEFTMLDPHIRTALLPVPGKEGEYSITFRAPDRHGVFKFVIDYKRKGWTQLHSTTVVPLVPPRHDGYPRFLSAAWPYYAGAISTSVGFLLFSAVWLAGDDKEARKGRKTE